MKHSILTSMAMREADRRAIEELGIPGLVLMENAARGACDVLAAHMGSLRGRRIAVICGKGNNGGDGLGLARHAIIAGATVTCALLASADELPPDARAQHDMLAAFAPDALTPWETFDRDGAYDAVVDAMLGTGSHGAPRGNYREAIGWCNRHDGVRLAIDIPSGVDADTGRAAGEAFAAHATATMAAPKPGLLLNEGPEKSGAITVVEIGAPVMLYERSPIELLDAARAVAGIAPIDGGRNKYDRGKVLVAAGSRGMSGAAVMAAEASLRAGAGLTVLALPDGVARDLPQRIAPEIMTLALPSGEDGAFAADAFASIIETSESYGAIAIGPGLSRSAAAANAVRSLVRAARAPIVLDADGLNAYAGNPALLGERAGGMVITPHHGEMARLLGLERADITGDPLGHAARAAELTGCIVVLKGAPTVVALPGGRLFINAAGNPGMATGGTGDVLTGTVASLLAQGRDPEESTLAAVYLHSLAGDHAAAAVGIRSLVATDIIASLPQAYRTLFPQ